MSNVLLTKSEFTAALKFKRLVDVARIFFLRIHLHRVNISMFISVGICIPLVFIRNRGASTVHLEVIILKDTLLLIIRVAILSNKIAFFPPMVSYKYHSFLGRLMFVNLIVNDHKRFLLDRQTTFKVRTHGTLLDPWFEQSCKECWHKSKSITNIWEMGNNKNSDSSNSKRRF